VRRKREGRERRVWRASQERGEGEEGLEGGVQYFSVRGGVSPFSAFTLSTRRRADVFLTSLPLSLLLRPCLPPPMTLLYSDSSLPAPDDTATPPVLRVVFCDNGPCTRSSTNSPVVLASYKDRIAE
jgi:hypothetical protein